MSEAQLSETVKTGTTTRKQASAAALTTVALLASGSLMGITGLTFLAKYWGFTAVSKAWGAIGVSDKALEIAHQVGAVSFLGSAGVHISARRKAVKKHVKDVYDAYLR